MLVHANPPSPSLKDLAWSHPAPPFTWIHITQATLGEGTIYYEPGTGREMHARSGGHRARDHFYYKADYSIPLHPDERRTNEGIAHILMKEAIMERRYMNVNVHGNPVQISFAEIRAEHHIPTPEGSYRIDLQCDIAGPERIKELFGHAVNIEIWSHHRLPSEKMEWLRTQSIATIEFRIYPKARNEIEAEMNAIIKEGQQLCDADFRRWTNRLAGTLNRDLSAKVQYLPNDNFDAIVAHDEMVPSLMGLVPPATIAPELHSTRAPLSLTDQQVASFPQADTKFLPPKIDPESRTWQQWMIEKWAAFWR